METHTFVVVALVEREETLTREVSEDGEALLHINHVVWREDDDDV